MPEHSQNGWPVVTRDRTTSFTVVGETFLAATADVAYLAKYLITRYDAEVEKLPGKPLDDWSYAARKVRGSSTTISNHASATAFDLNATKHPRGVHGTFSAAKTKAVRHILAAITDNHGHQVFLWGNDFTTVIDSMHFEINGTAAQVKQARAKLETEDDMNWGDKVKLTAVDAKIWGAGYKAGDKVTISAMLRYPTLMRKVDAELKAFAAASAKRDAAIAAQLKALAAAVAALPSGSSAEVSAAFTNGVNDLQAAVAQVDADTAAAGSGSDDDDPEDNTGDTT